MQDQVEYVCPVCGEDIVTPVDPTQGEHQEYVEDCPICCSPVVLKVHFRDDDTVDCEARPEY